MQLAIDNSTGRVLAKYNDGQEIAMENYGDDVELIQWGRAFDMVLTEEGDLPLDPRDAAEREAGVRTRHLRRRLQNRPSPRACLEMIYRDMRDGTNKYVETLQAIDQLYPARTQ